MAFLGLVPSERSTGERVRRAGLTYEAPYLRHRMRRGVASHARGGRLADKACRHLGAETADTCGRALIT
jgi:transposase